VIDVMVVPERFEDTVGETADQNVLYRLLAQIMIDAVDLLFAHHAQQAGVERFGGSQVVTERFFDHHPAKGVGLLLEQPAAAQPLRYFTEEARRGGQVEHGVASAVALDALGDGLVGGIVEEVAGNVADPLAQLGPQGRIEDLFRLLDPLGPGLLDDERLKLGGKFRVADLVMVDPDDVQTVVQQSIPAQIVQGRHQQAFDKVAIGAEQKQG
jgi:hypothetical protein